MAPVAARHGIIDRDSDENKITGLVGLSAYVHEEIALDGTRYLWISITLQGSQWGNPGTGEAHNFRIRLDGPMVSGPMDIEARGPLSEWWNSHLPDAEFIQWLSGQSEEREEQHYHETPDGQPRYMCIEFDAPSYDDAAGVLEKAAKPGRMSLVPRPRGTDGVWTAVGPARMIGWAAQWFAINGISCRVSEP